MPKHESLAETFEALRSLLARHAATLDVSVDTRAEYQLSSRTLKDRSGRPLFVAAVQTKKNYVSFHLLPLYMNPRLKKALSPALLKRMQGMACFNFRTPGEADAAARELAEVTRTAIDDFRNVKLPWAKPGLSVRPRVTAARPRRARARR